MQDFFDIDSALSEEERAVRASVRQFVDERILPIIGDCYVEGRFPKEIIPGLAELGVFGANLPEEYGCAGLNNVAYGLIMQELERGDSGIRSFASVQGALVDVSDLRVRQRGAEEALSAEDGRWGVDRMLRPHRAGFRLEPIGDDHDGEGAGRWLVDFERREDVDHERLAGEGRDRVGEDERREERQVDSRLHRAHGHEGLHGEGSERKALAARIRYE